MRLDTIFLAWRFNLTFLVIRMSAQFKTDLLSVKPMNAIRLKHKITDHIMSLTQFSKEIKNCGVLYSVRTWI